MMKDDGGVMKYIHMLAIILLIIGGINWGLVGFFNVNLVTMIFGTEMVAKIVYGLVFLSAVFEIFACCRCCSSCKK